MLDDDRKKDYSSKLSLAKDFEELYRAVEQGYVDKQTRNEDNDRYWKIYNCELTDEQQYGGDSQVFIPVVHDAVEARQLRFTNALFPRNGRYVEVTADTGDTPYALMTLLDWYVRQTKLRLLTPAMLRQGDVTGQYSVYVDWEKTKRKTLKRVRVPVELQGGVEVPDEDKEDIQEVEVVTERPIVDVINDEDLCVLPPTVDDIEKANVVSIAMRVTKSWLQAKKKEKGWNKSELENLIEEMSNANAQQPDPNKDKAQAAGVKIDSKQSKTVLIYQVWSELKLEGKKKVRARTYFGGPNRVLSCNRHPHWNDKWPVISAPLRKIAGSFWGMSPIEPVEKVAYQVNDAANMALDSAKFALMPIIMTDPNKNPRVGSMVLNLAAIWEVDPQSTQFAQFPALWKDGMEIVGQGKSQINQSLGVNPAMISQTTKTKKNQAEVAQDQLAALESTADVVNTLEDSIFGPMIERFFELDQQYRDDPVIVAALGPLGIEVAQTTIQPAQFDGRYQFRWYGTEAIYSQQRMQQQTAALNVLRSFGPQLPNGVGIDVSPIIENLVENAFGPRIARKILSNEADKLSVPVDIENDLLLSGFPVPVHALDDFQEHIKGHQTGMAIAADKGPFMAHILEHFKEREKKEAAQKPKGIQGAPGGGLPGLAGTPKPGAVPAPPRGGQAPPGGISPDQMQDPRQMPRKN